MRWLLNSAVRRDAGYRGRFTDEELRDVEAFYDNRPQLLPTPLLSLAHLAGQLSIGGLLVKDETARFGLEAFKIAGARYAIESLPRPRVRAGVVCATAGNHGRAVARAARDLGIRCTVFLPAPHEYATELELGIRRARVAGMRADGADVQDVPGTYEEAVRRATEYARRAEATMFSDTAADPDDAVARRITIGYTRVLAEASRQWHAPPHLILIQGGVGGLCCAAANWVAARYGATRPFLVACEPDSAACLLESARAGRLVHLGTDPRSPSPDPRAPTMMAGLRCAVPSAAAWPSIQAGMDAFVSVPDSIVTSAMQTLRNPAAADPPLPTGPSGACGAGALLALVRAPELRDFRSAIGLSRTTRVMVIATEGP